MAKVGFYKRYLYIIDRLTIVPSSFRDLHKHVLAKLKNDDLGNNFDYSSRTFDRDKKDIFDLFGILIQYNRKAKVYSIDQEIVDPSVSRMIEALSIHQVLKEGNKLSTSIYLEKRKVAGTHLINGILYAIQNRFMISFTHMKFWDMEISQRRVKPIAIKESERRWYLIAQDVKDGSVKNFGFDRITDLKMRFRLCQDLFKELKKEKANQFLLLQEEMEHIV
ncbi:WYL domain-containing protein [Flavobacterium fryxellicola]|uniref:WYL domain-containing protein n=1 Tax=Flavobacterium fryxellicola TaxID=249352 RepID=A0A167U709_9FLAO|nr:WYL domain-containing protein [Flavobacterium fryxellicola]OAB25318.1 hypothetical protein FBFR_15145 [Flavobacterium fryxellicola]SHN75164.1 WYL domain-containing protein [Flavobacterium fryxellicola]